jgi:hypothetical protein
MAAVRQPPMAITMFSGIRTALSCRAAEVMGDQAVYFHARPDCVIYSYKKKPLPRERLRSVLSEQISADLPVPGH